MAVLHAPHPNNFAPDGSRKQPVSATSPAKFPGYSRAILYPAAMLTVGAAFIHFSVVQDHLDEYLPFGLLFIAVGIAQMLLAVFLLERPSRRLFVWGIVGSLGVLAVWAVSRTLGLPVGPHPWRPEPAGFPDMIADTFEGVSVVLLGCLVRQSPHHSGVWGQPRRTLFATIPTLVLVGSLGFVGVETALNDESMNMNMSLARPGPGTISVDSLVEAPGPEPVRDFTLTAQVATSTATQPGPITAAFQAPSCA